MRIVPLWLIALSASANPNDSLQFTAGINVTHDDNLFRLAPGTDAQSTIGRSSPAETITTSTAGISFIKDYGLQHVEINAAASNYDYKKFSYLDFTGLNYDGLLRWSLTPRIRGTVTASRSEQLAGFGDFKNFSVRNENITTRERAEGLYELDGAWALTAAASNFSVKNTATIIQSRAFSQNSADVGIRRAYGSGTEIAYRFRKGTGSYSDVSFAAAALLPPGFDTTENEVSLNWLITDKSRLDTLITYRQKKFQDFGFRDYNGLNASVNLTLGLTSRSTLLVGYVRDVNDYQTTYSNQTTGNKIILEPAWQVKEKVALKFHQEITRRSFSGSVTGSAPAPDRTDDQYLSRVSVDWKPREEIALSAWLARDKRDSNYTGFPYVSNSVGLSAQVGF